MLENLQKLYLRKSGFRTTVASNGFVITFENGNQLHVFISQYSGCTPFCDGQKEYIDSEFAIVGTKNCNIKIMDKLGNDITEQITTYKELKQVTPSQFVEIINKVAYNKIKNNKYKAMVLKLADKLNLHQKNGRFYAEGEGETTELCKELNDLLYEKNL